MVEVLRLGYPGYKQCALKMDRAIVGEFGHGRGRKGFADRLGKKYYWILLHRLLGLLADNVTTKTSYWGWKVEAQHLWSVKVRKVDLTDIRDITTPREYPDELLQLPLHPFPDHSSDIKQWVSTDDFPAHKECIVRTSSTGKVWIALSLNINDSDVPSEKDSWKETHLRVDLFYMSIFVDGDVRAFGYERDPYEIHDAHYYRGYLAEYPDSPVFDQAAEEGDFYRGPTGMDFAEVTLMRDGEWEYEFSYAITERPEHLYVPCQDLLKVLGLTWDRQRGWLDNNRELVAFESQAKRRRGLFIQRDALNTYLATMKRKLIFRRFAIRGFYTNDSTHSLQSDLLTWLSYQPSKSPKVLNEMRRSSWERS
jgi:hypothetical protein